ANPQVRMACITVSTAISEAWTFNKVIEDWKSSELNVRQSCSCLANSSILATITARSFASDILAWVKCAAAGGICPPDARAALRTKSRARSTAPAAIPAPTDDQHRWATGVIVWE